MALFGKRFKNRTFDYIPRYYDQEKDDLERRLGKHESDDPNAVKLRIREGFKQKGKVDPKTRASISKKSNMRLFIIIIALVLITLKIMDKAVPVLTDWMTQ